MSGVLSYEEFEVLSRLAVKGGADACRSDAVARLRERGLVGDGGVTQAGLDALEPYRVKRAVVLAAGFGSRMAPVTLATPKPLVKVRGRRIIDTVLDALVAAGIEDIYIVRGYLARQFDQLARDYPGVHFIENDRFAESNNISSIVAARDYLPGAYVCEADLVLNEPSLITPYQYRTNYLGAPVAHTDDWCFKTKGGLITALLVGADDCHHMYGISYWTDEDGRKLGRDAAEVFERPGGADAYWDEVALRAFAGNYAVYVRECSFDDVAEIDTLGELVQIDPSYARLLEER